jgi:signal peptidase I
MSEPTSNEHLPDPSTERPDGTGSASAGDPKGRLSSRTGRLFFTLVAPALVALFLLRVAIPSRLEGARGGLAGVLAYLADEHSLFVFVALFVLLSEVGRYWYRRGHVEAPAEPLGKRRVIRFTAVVVALALTAFFVRSSVAGVVRVVGPSMLPTLEIGDRVLLNRIAYGFTLPFTKKKPGAAGSIPTRGDLIVFTAKVPGTADGPQRLVKRVIGVPADTVDGEEGSLRINGWHVPTCDAGPYAVMVGRLTVRGRLAVEFLGDRTYLTVSKVADRFPAYTVKPGEVYVAGDDRGFSSDSRLWGDTTGSGVPISALEGRVTRVLVGASPDGSLDLSRLLAPPLGLEVRQPYLDMTATKARIDVCLKNRPKDTTPPLPGRAAVGATR